jgi:hypothetical protein
VGGLSQRRGALGHHGDTPGHGLGQGRIAGHCGHLILPEVEVAAREHLEIRRRF